MEIEKNKRLSQSLIWELQRKIYCEFGPQAWSDKGVPSYITSNPFTVRAYAHVALGYLRDLLSQGTIDLSQPIYIFDLGAGTGRFCYLFLKHFIPFLNLPELQSIKICYVLTDIAEKNIEFWKSHPYLQPFIERKILDFAYFHHLGNETGIELRVSNQMLHKTKNPIIAIANYFFDTIPQDLFKITHGELAEGLITLSIDKKNTHTDSDVISQMTCSYTYKPIHSLDNYYAQNSENQLLKSYVDEFTNATLLIPIGGLTTISYFMQLSDKRMCLLAGDQGICSREKIATSQEPKIARHGTFSIPVNYHALSRFFTMQDGLGLLTHAADPQYVVLAGLFGTGAFEETKLAFQTFFTYFEPSDYFNLVNYCSETTGQELCFDYILQLVKLGNWDPMVFNTFLPTIEHTATSLSAEKKAELRNMMQQVSDHYFPLSQESGHFFMRLGHLAYKMGDYEEALGYFRKASIHLGEQHKVISTT